MNINSCRKCGGRAELRGLTATYVFCISCGAKTRRYYGENAAVETWNRRNRISRGEIAKTKTVWRRDGNNFYGLHADGGIAEIVKQGGGYYVLGANDMCVDPPIFFKTNRIDGEKKYRRLLIKKINMKNVEEITND